MISKSRILAAIALAAIAAAPSVAQCADFSGPGLHGGTVSLAGHRGRIVVVNFWANWCPGCKLDIAAVNAFYSRYHGKGVDMIGVNQDSLDDRDKAAAMAARMSYPSAMAREASVNSFGTPSGLPAAYIIDRDGQIQGEIHGGEHGLSEQALEAAVAPLLGH
jgi:peroxiredoxin